MRILSKLILMITMVIMPCMAHAILSMELTRGTSGAIPIAVVPFFAKDNKLPQDVSRIITNDLQFSGRFKVYGQNDIKELPLDANHISVPYFKRLGTDNVVMGKVTALSDGQYEVNFQLVDIYKGKGNDSILISKTYTVNANELRAVAHHVSDLVYEKITGTRGIFSTKLVYVVIQGEGNNKRYILEVSDQDGYNPKQLLISPEPIMSPSWSPNGRQIAYVSFENKHASIYIQSIASGARRLLSDYPGINGAPAWSPDGRKLAIVLSKSGSPNIYTIDIASHRLTQVTRDYYINTEPVWSADGRLIMFTSNRSGGPQIYQANLANNEISRISYDGTYNARPTFAKDGRNIAMIHRISDVYRIAILNLDTGTTRVLSNSTGDSSSPSIAPNGSMILYDTVYHGRNVLAMVSADGSIQLVLPDRNGEAQDPAWSPFLS